MASRPAARVSDRLGSVAYRHRALALCVAAYFGTRVGQVVVGPLVPAVRDAFGVSAAAVGAALTGMWAAYALAQLPSGVLAARHGERRVVLAALALVGATSLALAAAPSFAALAAVVAVLGAGAGLYYNAGTTLVEREFDAVGRAVGVHRIGGQAAGLVAPGLAGLAAWLGGWRAGLAVGAAVTVPLVGLAAVGLRETPPARTDGRGAVRPALVHLRSPAVLRLGGVAAAGEFVTVAAVSFLPTFLVTYHGVGPVTAGALFGGYFLLVGAVQPVAGWLTDRRSPAPVTALALAAGVAGVAVLVAGPRSGMPVGVALLGVSGGWTTPTQTAAMDALPAGARRTGFGAFRTGYVLAGASGSLVCGLVAETAGWGAAFGTLGACLVAALLVVAGELRSDAS